MRVWPARTRRESAQAGFTLLEVVIALAVAIVLLGASVVTLQSRQNTAGVRVTVDSLLTLREAVRRAQAASGVWPTDLVSLRGVYVPASATLTTAWGDAYTLSSTPTLATIAANVPVVLPVGTNFGPLVTVSVGAGATSLAAQIGPSGRAADLDLERRRVTGGS